MLDVEFIVLKHTVQLIAVLVWFFWVEDYEDDGEGRQCSKTSSTCGTWMDSV